jgi:hypothetical protein
MGTLCAAAAHAFYMNETSSTWSDNPSLTREGAGALRKGDRIRLTDATGRIAQGTIEGTGGFRAHIADTLVLHGISWAVTDVTVWALGDLDTAAGDISPARLSLNAEALRELISDIGGAELNAFGKAPAVNFDSIVRKALGFDPTLGRSAKAYGGHTSGYFVNQHFAANAAKKLLDGMVSAGELRAAKEGSRYIAGDGDSRYVSFPYGAKTGWVLEDLYQAALVAVGSAAEDARLAKLLVQARATVADRHPAEVEAELALLLAR